MAVLGVGGVLGISRAIPEPIALSSARINTGGATTTISLTNPGYWTGDRIIIASSLGVPFDFNGDGYADCPDGHGVYRGGTWDTGISRAFYTGTETNASPFYHQYTATTPVQVFTKEEDEENFYLGAEDDSLFYDNTINGDAELFYSPYLAIVTLYPITREEDDDDFYNNGVNTGLATQGDGYMSRDELDRIRLWTTEGAAHSGNGTEKEIFKVKCGNFVVTSYSDDTDYTSAINAAATELNALTLLQSEQPLKDVVTLPAGFAALCENANRNWKLQCDLEEWVMSIDASNLDTTAIGETFGENIKSLVRGAGSLQFLAEHSSVATEEDGLALLRLVLLTQNQCNTRARFHIYKNRTAPSPRIDGSVYYECDILLTNTRLNTRATEVIAGTADFVATSEIKLKVAA